MYQAVCKVVAWDTRDNRIEVTSNVSRSVFDMGCRWKREVQTQADTLVDALNERTDGTQSQERAVTGTLLSDSMCGLRDVHEFAVHTLTTQASTAFVTPLVTYLKPIRANHRSGLERSTETSYEASYVQSTEYKWKECVKEAQTCRLHVSKGEKKRSGSCPSSTTDQPTNLLLPSVSPLLFPCSNQKLE